MKPICRTHRTDIICDILFDFLLLFIIVSVTLLVCRS